MKVKLHNVASLTLHPAIEHACNVIDRVWWKHTGEHPVVTGLGEEGHSKGSRHYGLVGDIRCRAVDVRTRDLSLEDKILIEDELKIRLGGGLEFDIVWEETHLHCEFDPK